MSVINGSVPYTDLSAGQSQQVDMGIGLTCSSGQSYLSCTRGRFCAESSQFAMLRKSSFHSLTPTTCTLLSFRPAKYKGCSIISGKCMLPANKLELVYPSAASP